ncbi:hypothetical protein [Streptomyces variegatus]|uniref:hypothetical protein n=1 Tax=Streptomyces variegatus TaxID=284040 RepID=UPI003C3078AA
MELPGKSSMGFVSVMVGQGSPADRRRSQGGSCNTAGHIRTTNRSEHVTLPWKKSDKLTLSSTERKVGITVSVVPGPMRLSNGQFAAAPCSITVDGKKVAENPGGADGKHMCEYTLR